jgi:hypothetical protein
MTFEFPKGQALAPRRDSVLAALMTRRAPRRRGDAVVFPTDVMLPSGVNVVAYIEGGRAGDRVTATDGGDALHEVIATGRELTDHAMRAAGRAAKRYGLTLEGTVLRSLPEAIEDARAAAILLANGARAVAEAALAASRKRERAMFRDRVRADLLRIFDDSKLQQRAPMAGASEDQHRFDWLVGMPGGRHLVLDVPVPDHSSIAAVIVRHLDLKELHRSDVVQAITYDDRDEWATQQIAQLRLAQADLIPAQFLIERLQGFNAR